MTQFSFAQINDAENGQQIPSFVGTVKKVFAPKTGVGDYGAWSLQSIILQDDHANEITITWTNYDQWTDQSVGKTYLFESGYDKKEQLCGLKKEIRKKNGKTYESVKVDDRAKIQVLGGKDRAASESTGEANNPAAGRDDPPDHSQERPQNAPQSPPARFNGDDGVQHTRKHLMRACNLYVLCVKAADKAVAPHMPEIARTSEQFGAIVGQLFRESYTKRTDDGVNWYSYVDFMPDKPIKDVAEAAQ